MGEIPLNSGKCYHASIFYNHARSPMSITEDQKVSLHVVEHIAGLLDEWGYTKYFYHERDALPGRNIFGELFRVINGSQWIIVVLTKGFVCNCWGQYCQQAAFKKLLDEGDSEKLLPIAVELEEKDIPENLGVNAVTFFGEDWRENSNGWMKLKRVLEGEAVTETQCPGIPHPRSHQDHPDSKLDLTFGSRMTFHGGEVNIHTEGPIPMPEATPAGQNSVDGMASLSKEFASVAITGGGHITTHGAKVNIGRAATPAPTPVPVPVPVPSAPVTDHKKTATEECQGHFMKTNNENVYEESNIHYINETMKRVGRVTSPQTMATAFLVGERYAFTAWHVVKKIVESKELPNPGVDLDRLKSKEVCINFISPGKKTTTYYISGLPYKDEDLDVALLELQPPEKTDVPSTPLMSELCDATELHIVGYGHRDFPDNKHVDLRCQIINSNSDEYKSACAWLEENKSTFFDVDYEDIANAYGKIRDEDFVCCDSFLTFGASGSPMAVMKNGDRFIVGIYTQGIPGFYWQRYKLFKNVLPEKYAFGCGALMSKVLASMKNQNVSEDIINNIFPPQPGVGRTCLLSEVVLFGQ